MVGVTAVHEEVRERLGEDQSVRLRGVNVQVPQRIADASTVAHGSRQLSRASARSLSPVHPLIVAGDEIPGGGTYEVGRALGVA